MLPTGRARVRPRPTSGQGDPLPPATDDGRIYVADGDGVAWSGVGGRGPSRRRRGWRGLGSPWVAAGVVALGAAAAAASSCALGSGIGAHAFVIPRPPIPPWPPSRPAAAHLPRGPLPVLRAKPPSNANPPGRGQGDGAGGGFNRNGSNNNRRRRPSSSGGGGRDRGKAANENGRKWERSAPEEFLLVLTNLRAQFGHLDEEGAIVAAAEDPGAVERDVGLIITLVRALATRQWAPGAEAASSLCESPLLDVVLGRMVLYAATQAADPDLALALLSGMHARRIDVDAFMASLVAKAAAKDRRWMPVVEVCKAQLSTNPVILGTARRAGGSGRRHEGFTQALAATVERGKFYSSSFLVDALLQFQMVDLFTAKVALKFYRFSRTPVRALPWITTAKAIGLVPDADLDFEVGRVYKSLGMWREAVALLGEMVEKGRAVSDEHVGVVLSACHQAGEWRECMELLERIKGWGLRVGRVSYLIVLRLLLEKGRVDQARIVLDQMAAQATPLDDETARLVLFSLAKRGPVQSSLEFLRLMRVHGVGPDLVTYTAALRACARFREPDRALEVLQAMEREGVQPDMLAVAAVMEALTGVDRWDEAFALFDMARVKGLRPDIKGWTQVLNQATQAGRWDLFSPYLEAAVASARAGTATLDLRFFATVINACAEASRTDEALAVLASVRSYGLTPNVYCYSAAAKSCLARNRWRDALELLAEAQALGIPADATLYRTVLRCCWQARQWKSVLQLYGEMLARGLEVDPRMYHQLMDAVARAGQAELASDLLQEMAANGVKPLDATLSAFLQCWYVKGEYGRAWATLEGLWRWDSVEEEEVGAHSSRDFAPGPGAFADLMAVCAKREDWEEVLALRERMGMYGLGNDLSLTLTAPHLVARAHAELGRWVEAERFMGEEMAADGGYTEAVWRRTYTALLALCSKRIEPERALALLAEMQAPPRSLPPSADDFHLAMDACAQAGMVQEVRSLFQALRAQGAEEAPRVESFTIMLELCAREGGKCGEALALMGELEMLGLTPDVLCLNAAMDACRDNVEEEGVRTRMKRWREQEIMHTYNSEMAVLAARPALSAAAAASGGGATGGAAAAVRLLQEMEHNGIPRDTDTFNMALEACARGGDLPATQRVFDALEAHPQAGPDVFSYVTLACALVRDGRGSQGMAVLSRMVALDGTSGGPRRKTRWPAYYRELWPQTAKALGKAILALAAEDGARCDEMGKLLQFLTMHMPILNAQAVAEQLVVKGLCGTEHITTLTGGSLATKWADGAVARGLL